MKSTLLLAALLIFASSSHAQVREGMAAPAQQPAFNSPDADDDPPENPYINSWGDDDCCTVAPIQVEPSSDASSQPAEEPGVVEGSNDGEYVPSTFMPYQKALHEAMQELAAMRGEQLAQVSQTVGKSRASRSPQDVKTADAKPARTATPANAPSAAQRTAVKEETVAEAARENREKQASGEKPKIVIEQDSKGQIVVEDEN